MTTDRERLVKLLRARHPLVSIVTAEEGRALDTVVGAAIDLGRQVLTWSAVRGLCSGLFHEEVDKRPDSHVPAKALRMLALEDHTKVLIMLDLGAHLEDAVTARAARELVEHCRRARATLVLIDHQMRLPETLERAAIRCDLTLPDDTELAAIAKEALHQLKAEDPSISLRISKTDFQALVRQLRGLTRAQAAQLVADAAVEDDLVDGDDVAFVAARKRHLLRTSGLLEPVEAPVSLDQVAGAEGLKEWLELRRAAVDGELPGIEAPRGVLLLGVPGTGKSYCAKAIATAWQRPLLRLDAGVLYDKFVGESERRLREALRQAEAMAPMVLWIDEIEKAFASAASHSTDGGLSQRMFGSLLTWMQERRAAVFLVATANDIEALPAELLRKGRFDEIFFIDLPGASARRDLFRIHLTRRGQDPAAYDLAALADAAARFSGAEIEHAVATVVLESHARSAPPTTTALLATIAASTPLAVTMAEQVARLRSWAATRCRAASRPDAGVAHGR